MRWLVPLTAMAALAFAQSAAAAPVSVGSVSFSPEMQTTLERRLGDREGPMLQDDVSRALTRALRRAGAEVGPGAGVTVETTIVDADPNLPTMKELSDMPGLSMIDSMSIGGAELHAVIRGADGRTLAEVNHRRYSMSLLDIDFPTTQWHDAQRAIRQFAEKVADAYESLPR